jgi:hypothetical protein
MPLMQLPPEIDVQLLPMLDYASLMSLTVTNRYYFSLRTDNLVRQALLYFEEACMKEWRPEYGFVSFDLETYCTMPEALVPGASDFGPFVLPCYGCLRIRRRNADFEYRQRRGKKCLNCKRAEERRCKACPKALRRSRIAKAKKPA